MTHTRHATHAHARPRSPQSPPHLSAGTACVWSCCLPPWSMQEASALRTTRHQFTGRRSTPVIHLRYENAQAERYWTQRKMQLGLTRDLSLSEKMAIVIQARKERVHHAPEQSRHAPTRVQSMGLHTALRRFQASLGVTASVADNPAGSSLDVRISREREQGMGFSVP
jgi:hypothetical protein